MINIYFSSLLYLLPLHPIFTPSTARYNERIEKSPLQTPVAQVQGFVSQTAGTTYGCLHSFLTKPHQQGHGRSWLVLAVSCEDSPRWLLSQDIRVSLWHMPELAQSRGASPVRPGLPTQHEPLISAVMPGRACLQPSGKGARGEGPLLSASRPRPQFTTETFNCSVKKLSVY